MKRPTVRTLFRALGLTLGMLVLLALAASLALTGLWPEAARQGAKRALAAGRLVGSGVL